MQSKGYVEDVGDEFTFAKILPNQSLIQGELNIFNPNIQNIAKAKITHSLDSAAIRKLIYARFADEIAAKPRNVLEAKSHETKEYVGAIAKSDIADEFKELKSQGYDFVSARKAIENQNVRSLSDRMKGLLISGYISNYGGESGLKEEVEGLMHKQALVIEEFMQRLTGEIEVHSTKLLG